MKRWRRTLLLAALLLLAGAVVNVAVAWVFVGAPDSWTYGGTQTVPAEEYGLQLITEQVRTPQDWPIATDGAVRRGLGWTVFDATSLGTDWGNWHVIRIAAGWPLRSLSCKTTMLGHEKWREHRSASFDPPRRVSPAGWFEFWRDRVPLAPLLPGFLLNTFFYAAVLALPLMLVPLRRRLRDRCPKCNYDLAGLDGPCPECGAERRSH